MPKENELEREREREREKKKIITDMHYIRRRTGTDGYDTTIEQRGGITWLQSSAARSITIRGIFAKKYTATARRVGKAGEDSCSS